MLKHKQFHALQCFYIIGRSNSSKEYQLLFQETLKTNYLRIIHFLEFSKNYLVKQNPIKAISQQIIEGLKDFLTMNKKLKLSKYRVNYHRHQLQKMENLIAQNNDHVFLRGNKLNEMR